MISSAESRWWGQSQALPHHSRDTFGVESEVLQSELLLDFSFQDFLHLLHLDSQADQLAAGTIRAPEVARYTTGLRMLVNRYEQGEAVEPINQLPVQRFAIAQVDDRYREPNGAQRLGRQQAREDG